MSDGPTGHEFDNRRHLGHRSWQEQCMMGEGDEGKTREQLVDEVRAFRAETAALRGRVACLEAVEQFLARLLDRTPAPFYVTDRDGRPRLVNRAWEELWGLPREEVVGRTADEIFPPELARLLWDQNQQVLETAAPIEFEEIVTAADGRHYLQTVKFPLRDADGRIEAVGGISFDVTERKRTELALEESRRRLEALFDNTLDAMWLLDDEGRFVDANPAVYALLGYSREEFLRMSIADVVTVQDQGLARDLWHTFLTRGRLSGEFTQVRKDGSTLEVNYRAVAHILPGLHLLVNRDITETKKVQAERDRLLRQLRLQIDRLPLAYIMVDTDGRVLEWNPAAEQMFGYTKEEALGRESLDLIVPPAARDHVQGVVRPVPAGDTHVTCINENWTRDGRIITCEWFNTLLSDANGQYAGRIGVAHDIGDRKRAKAALRRYAERARILSRLVVEVQEQERRHLARELHDEIGQTFTAIRINLDAIKRTCSALELPRLEECIGIVDGAIDQVHGLALDLRPAMLDDLGLVATLRWYLDQQAQRVGYRAQFAAEPAEIGLSLTAATAVFRVAQEALTNIARHARARRVRISLRLRDGTLRLVVRDDGVGFDPEATLRRRSGGRGLGLPGMRERASWLGGRFAVRSTPGQGTKVRLTLPLKAAHEGA